MFGADCKEPDLLMDLLCTKISGEWGSSQGAENPAIGKVPSNRNLAQMSWVTLHPSLKSQALERINLMDAQIKKYSIVLNSNSWLWGLRVLPDYITMLTTPNTLKTHLASLNTQGKNGHFQFSSVQLLSRVWLIVTPWNAACQASLSITNFQSLPKPMSIESVMLSKHLILCRPLLLLPSTFLSIRVFSNESVLHIRWPKY